MFFQFPYRTVLRALGGNQTIASCVVLTHQVAMLMAYFIILLPNNIMTRWLFIKAQGSARHSVI